MRKLKNWLESYAEYLKKCHAPDTYITWSGLFMLSAALRRKAWIDFGHYKDYANLFVVFVGPPGTFKSTICDITTDLIADIPDIVLGADDATMQSIVQKIGRSQKSFMYNGIEYFHKSVVAVVPEWGSLIGDKDKVKCRVLARLYDCADRYLKETKTQGDDTLIKYFYTMFGATTKKDIQDCLPASAIGQGLGSRIIFVVESPVDTKPPKKYKLNTALRQALIDDLAYINDVVIGDFTITEKAEEYYDKWYEEEKKYRLIDDKNFDYYYNRKVNKFIYQVSLLLKVSYSDERIIGLEDIKKAIALFSEIEIRMPEALGGVGDNPLAKIISAVRNLFIDAKTKKRKKKLSMRYIGAELWQLCTSWDLDRAIKQMINNMGIVELSKDGKYLIWRENK